MEFTMLFLGLTVLLLVALRLELSVETQTAHAGKPANSSNLDK
jgi:hypothetical protein